MTENHIKQNWEFKIILAFYLENIKAQCFWFISRIFDSTT